VVLIKKSTRAVIQAILSGQPADLNAAPALPTLAIFNSPSLEVSALLYGIDPSTNPAIIGVSSTLPDTFAPTGQAAVLAASIMYGVGFDETSYDRVRLRGDNADAIPIAAVGRLLANARNYGFNGVSWDRLRSAGDNADAQVPASLGRQIVAARLFTFNGTNWDRLQTLADNQASSTVKLPVLPARANSAVSPLTEGFTQPLFVDLNGLLRSRMDLWLGSAAPTVGQKAMATSLPVAIASDQSAVAVDESDRAAREVGRVREWGNAWTWITAKTAAPLASAVQADTGALAAGDYDFDINMVVSDTNAVGKGLVVEHRDGANATTKQNLGGCSVPGNQWLHIQRYTLLGSERIRVIAGTAAGAASSMYVSAIGRRTSG
jgi:hypothetical protein